MVELVIMETLWSVVTAMVGVNIDNTIWLIVWVIVVLAGKEIIGLIVELMARSTFEGIFCSICLAYVGLLVVSNIID